MTRVLADTQILVWAAHNPQYLSNAAQTLLSDRGVEVTFSLVSIWEASIKFALDRPDFTLSPRVLRRGLLQMGFIELPITSEHVIAVSVLPLIHRDPFDRLLIAQAEYEGMILVTSDKKVAQYGGNIQRF